MNAQPWNTEPDQRHWRTRAGLMATVRRHLHMRFLCGYVEAPEELVVDALALDVHGGITWDENEYPIDTEVVTGVRVLGFDCGHAGDAIPAPWFPYPDATYRTFAYVEAECESLAMQIMEQQQ